MGGFCIIRISYDDCFSKPLLGLSNEDLPCCPEQSRVTYLYLGTHLVF